MIFCLIQLSQKLGWFKFKGINEWRACQLIRISNHSKEGREGNCYRGKEMRGKDLKVNVKDLVIPQNMCVFLKVSATKQSFWVRKMEQFKGTRKQLVILIRIITAIMKKTLLSSRWILRGHSLSLLWSFISAGLKFYGNNNWSKISKRKNGYLCIKPQNRLFKISKG